AHFAGGRHEVVTSIAMGKNACYMLTVGPTWSALPNKEDAKDDADDGRLGGTRSGARSVPCRCEDGRAQGCYLPAGEGWVGGGGVGGGRGQGAQRPRGAHQVVHDHGVQARQEDAQGELSHTRGPGNVNGGEARAPPPFLSCARIALRRR